MIGNLVRIGYLTVLAGTRNKKLKANLQKKQHFFLVLISGLNVNKLPL